MCVILNLPSGMNIDDNLLDCAVANNWHGYGIVLKDEHAQRLEVRRAYSEEKGADPEEIARILRDNDDVTRYVHLRHTTAGANGIDNCHPFPVYTSMNREVYLMHNGTIFDYKPKGEDKRNDSRIFCEEFVSELLLRFEGDMGKGDYNHPLIKNILHKQIGGANRLLVVSNDLDPLAVGDWVTVKNKDGSEFRASNNEYFYQIKRGPRHTYTPFRASNTQTGRAVVPWQANAGTNLKTETTGTNTQVSRSPAQQETKTLVEEAKAARTANGQTEVRTSNVVDSSVSEAARKPVVPLKDVESYSAPVPYQAPPALLDALGLSRKMFEDYGFDCLVWMQDDELTSAMKQISPVALGDMFRTMVEVLQDQATELDIAEQTIEGLIKENQRVTEKHRKASLKIEELQATSEPVRKVG